MYKVGRDTAHRALKEKGLVYKSVTQQQTLSEDQMNKRVTFCKLMLKRRAKPIDETFFSDEMGIKLSEAHPNKAWGEPYKKIKIEIPAKDIKLNCWGAISKKGATTLHIYRDNLDTGLYEKVVKKHIPEMQEIYPNNFSFVHDNSSIHSAAEKELKKHGLSLVKFPSYSPDLNPIKNLWSALKNNIAKDNPKTERQLVNSLKKNWQSLTQVEKLEPYFINLHDRYNQCINEKGHLIPY